jgi:L-fuculose-phosphate aldolase
VVNAECQQEGKALREVEGERELAMRRSLVKFSRWLSRLGFTPGTSGNLSVRLDAGRLMVTPTGVSKGLVKASDMVIVDLEGRRLAGSKRVTSEIGMHLAVYRERGDVHAVVHSHPPIATAFACSGRAIDQILCQEAVMTVGIVPLARYATTGTGEVAASLAPLLPEYDAILLENHGAVSYGKTLVEAFMKMETIEHLAHVALVTHQLGSAHPIGQEQLRQLHSAREKYLQNAPIERLEESALSGDGNYAASMTAEEEATDSLMGVSA